MCLCEFKRTKLNKMNITYIHRIKTKNNISPYTYPMSNENGCGDTLQQIEPVTTAQTVANVYRGQCSMSACDKLTMETMMNMEAFSKYMNRRSKNTGLCPHTSERKFYRRRIIDTTKEMLRDSKYINDGTVSTAFNAYINACIMHFKFIDLADTIQEDYSNLSASLATAAESLAKIEGSDDTATTVMNMNKMCFNPKLEESKSVKIRTTQANAIERLFVSKPIIIEQAEAKMETESKQIGFDKASPSPCSIPRTKDINIKDAQFKTKGIKPKTKVKNKNVNSELESHMD